MDGSYKRRIKELSRLLISRWVGCYGWKNPSLTNSCFGCVLFLYISSTHIKNWSILLPSPMSLDINQRFPGDADEVASSKVWYLKWYL